MSARGAGRGGKPNPAYLAEEGEEDIQSISENGSSFDDNNNKNNNNNNDVKDKGFDVPSQLLFDAIDSLEKQSKQSSSTSSTASFGIFFEDGKRRVDYILAHALVDEDSRKREEGDEEEVSLIRRRFYEEELSKDFGLELETADSAALGIRFVKVHAPWEVSGKYHRAYR